MYGVELSRDLLSSITDAVMDEVTAWQSRLLDSVYPVIYLNALWTKIRDEGTVRTNSIWPWASASKAR